MTRPFDARCPVWRAAQVFGDPWSLMILRDLFRDGPRRFQDFDAPGRGLSPNTLSRRLKALVDQGYVQTRPYSDNPPRNVYELTERGRTLGPVMQALYDWGMTDADHVSQQADKPQRKTPHP